MEAGAAVAGAFAGTTFTGAATLTGTAVADGLAFALTTFGAPFEAGVACGSWAAGSSGSSGSGGGATRMLATETVRGAGVAARPRPAAAGWISVNRNCSPTWWYDQISVTEIL